MNSTVVALVSMGCIFGGTLVGLALSRIVPAHHLSSDSRDAVKVGAGMISMMSALVLGLLVSSAKQNYDSTNDAIIQAGAKVILLDRALASYGSETKHIRDYLRQAVAQSIQLLWPEEGIQVPVATFERARGVEAVQQRIRELNPKNDVQRSLQGEALEICKELMLNRWLQIEQAQTSLPGPFLIILLFWLTMLYMSFGLLAPRNVTVVAIMFVGALALATALFLILEMNRPMAGTVKVSGAPMRKALEHLGR